MMQYLLDEWKWRGQYIGLIYIYIDVNVRLQIFDVK